MLTVSIYNIYVPTTKLKNVIQRSNKKIQWYNVRFVKKYKNQPNNSII